MDWTFWLLSGLAAFAIFAVLWLLWTIFGSGFEWDDNAGDWTDE